jgi:hypothetical protein
VGAGVEGTEEASIGHWLFPPSTQIKKNEKRKKVIHNILKPQMKTYF